MIKFQAPLVITSKVSGRTTTFRSARGRERRLSTRFIGEESASSGFFLNSRMIKTQFRNIFCLRFY